MIQSHKFFSYGHVLRQLYKTVHFHQLPLVSEFLNLQKNHVVVNKGLNDSGPFLTFVVYR